MRPPKEPRSALRYPLDAVLGSEVQVRIVRVLMHEVTDPLSVADIARLAGATPAGARKALERLEAAAFVERVGSGYAPKYQVRETAVARESLARAFEAEQAYYDGLIGGVRDAVALPEVIAAWCEPLPSDATSAIHAVVVVSANDVSWVRDEIRSRLAQTEKRFDVVVEVAMHTRADTPAPGAQDIPLWGLVGVTRVAGEPAPRTLAEASARSLRLAEEIAELLRTDPTLIRRAGQHLDRLIDEGQGMATADLAEWRQLLQTYSPDRLRDLLVSTSSRGERLRRSAPFFAVLTPDERDRVLSGLDDKR